MASGACNCGAVAFEVASPVSDVYVCHCSICRRSSGSNGMAVVVVNKSDFRWLRGEEFIASWDKPGADWQTWFCKQCGAKLPGENDATRLFIPAGLISKGGADLTVKHHIWVESRAHWDQIGDAGKQHPEGYES